MSSSAEATKTPQWFYLKDDQTIGPVDSATLRSLLATGEVVASSYVYQEGMKDWQRASVVFGEPEFANAVTQEQRPVTAGSEKVNVLGLSKWWPSSMTASAIFGTLLALAIAWVVRHLALMASVFSLTEQSPGAWAFLAFGRDLILLIAGYFTFVGLRTLLIIAPRERLRGKMGLAEPEKRSAFDALLENSRVHVATARVIGTVMLLQLFAYAAERTWHKSQIDQRGEEARALHQKSTELAGSKVVVQMEGAAGGLSEREIREFEAETKRVYDHDLRNGFPADLAAQSYRKSMSEVARLKRELEAQKTSKAEQGADMLDQGKHLLDEAVMSAARARAAKLMGFWNIPIMLLSYGFALWLWKVKQREQNFSPVS